MSLVACPSHAVLPREPLRIESTPIGAGTWRLSCVSGAAKPPPELTWSLDSRPVKTAREEEAGESRGETRSRADLVASESASHARCTSRLLLTQQRESSRLLSSRPDGSFFLRDGDASPAAATSQPLISGGKQSYRIGERLQLNCSSNEDSDSTRLRWFLTRLVEVGAESQQQQQQSLHPHRKQGTQATHLQRHNNGTQTLSLSLRIEQSWPRDLVMRCVASHKQLLHHESLEWLSPHRLVAGAHATLATLATGESLTPASLCPVAVTVQSLQSC